MKVLYLARPGDVSPWYHDFDSALGEEFEVVRCAPGRPFASQVQGVLAVADEGTPFEAGMVRDAREAGVKLWQLILEGYDQLDLDLFQANGSPVANTPGQFSERALAEHALMLMLCAIKGFSRSQQDLKAGLFYRSLGGELDGRTLGLIGTGASGRGARPAVPATRPAGRRDKPARARGRRSRPARHRGPGRAGQTRRPAV
jgi:phosphoglycerate dehydrogenase-like enzyme